MIDKNLDISTPAPIEFSAQGSVICACAAALVVTARIGNPPLRFVGRQMTHHWQRLYDGDVLSIWLWQRKKSGYVVAHSVFADGVIKTQSRVVASLPEAMTYLEGTCAALPIDTPAPAGPFINTLLVTQKMLTFRQVFGALAGEVLSIWDEQAARLTMT